ncbi:hypothetical protein ACXWOM_09705, partial [Streptococcus pyogenes]
AQAQAELLYPNTNYKDLVVEHLKQEEESLFKLPVPDMTFILLAKQETAQRSMMHRYQGDASKMDANERNSALMQKVVENYKAVPQESS